MSPVVIRWAHVIAAIMWIGDSFLFMWLDSQLKKPDRALQGDVVGELWMAHSGGFYEVDQAADQFAFCASMWEALFGTLPFSGATREEYLTAIEQGRLQPVAPESPVPAWIQRVLVRGLRAAPGQRYASMDELLLQFAPSHAAAGHAARITVVVAACVPGIVAAVFLWVVRSVSYALLAVWLAAALMMFLAVTAMTREQRRRSDLNTRGYLMSLVAFLGSVLLVAGSWRFGMAAIHAAYCITALWTTVMGIGAVTISWRLLPVSLTFACAFLIGAAGVRPYALGLLVAHVVLIATVWDLGSRTR